MSRAPAQRLRVLGAGVLLAALACAPPPRPLATPLTILVDPGPFASIEEAAAAEARVDGWQDWSTSATACTESFAALELRRFLASALGVDDTAIALARPDRLPERGDVFVLGSHATAPVLTSLLSRRADPIVDPPDGFRLRCLDRDGRRVFVVDGNERSGTLYGTYTLLETLGFRFYGLGDTGTVVPRAPLLPPRRLELAVAPGASARGFWAFEPRGNREFFLWMARNRMNLWTAEEPDAAFLHKLGIRLTGGGHRLQADYLDPRAPADSGAGRTRFAAHPEWYGLRAGRRRGDIAGESGTNFCTSNAEARAAFARALVRDLVAGRLRQADVVEVWPLDGGAWCECDSCRTQGSPTDRWLDVVAAVSAEKGAATQDRRLDRPVRLVAPAYLETLAPPTRPVSRDFGADCSVAFFPYFRCYAHALADTTCTELNRRLRLAYLGWTSDPDRFYRGHLAVGEYYNVSWVHSLPVLYTRAMAADLPWYLTHGAREVFTMHAPTSAWGAWTLDHALLARLLWNPDLPADSIAAEYCRSYFAEAAEPMRAYVSHLARATENITALAHCVGAFGTGAGVEGGRLVDPRFPLFPLQHLRQFAAGPSLNDAPDLEEIVTSMRQARVAIDEARARARDPRVRSRLREEERRFAYGEAMVRFWDALIRVAACHREGDAAGARRLWPEVEAEAERLRAVRELVQVAGSHADARDGLAASSVEPTYAFLKRRYGSGGW